MAKSNTRESRRVKGLPPLSPELLRSLTLDNVLGTIVDSLPVPFSSPVQRAKTNPLLESARSDLLGTKIHPPTREPQRNVKGGEEIGSIATAHADQHLFNQRYILQNVNFMFCMKNVDVFCCLVSDIHSTLRHYQASIKAL